MKNDRFIPLSIPNICGNELKYVTEAITTQWVSTAGGSITEFEKVFEDYTNSKKACACQSGTAGLHLCLRHYGVSTDDIVLVPSLTFIATINSIMYEHATPVFFDCDENLCINVNQIKDYLTQECRFDGEKVIEEKSGQQVKAIMPVHIFGDTCDMDLLMDLANEYKLIVIEDATESLGTRFTEGRYKGMHTGTVGHAGVFSFNGNKIITTGGGGMVISNDTSVIDHIKYLSQQAKDDVVNFVHNEVGFNYRMTNLQAALGLGQMEKLDEFIEVKRKNYNLYKTLLETCEFGQLKPFKEEAGANYWFYSFELNTPSIDFRDKFIAYLNQNNIQVRPIWKLNHLQKPFQKYKAMNCDQATKMYDSIINLPCSSNLTEEEVRIVCDVIKNFKI